MLRLGCICLCILETFGFTALVGKHQPNVTAAAPVAKAFLGQERQTQNSTANSTFRLADPPKCGCQVSSPTWKKTMRTTPKCIFIDLGAANGNTFEQFLNNGYGDVKNCAHGTGDYEAYLVEANPRFQAALMSVQAGNPKVHAMPSSAAYMCEGTTSFFLDTVNHDKNYWGSSMSNQHQDTKKSGLQKVTVPTVNVMKILYEKTIPGDWVMLKMDIEGAEWDIIPCLANAPVARNIDRFYIEQHPAAWIASGGPAPSESVMTDAKAKLSAKGVDMPGYFSQTL